MLPEHNPIFEKRSKAFTHAQRELDSFVKEWLPRMGLETWRGTVDYTGSISSRGEDILALVIPQWEYQQYHMTFFLPKWVDKTPEEMEFGVVHELSHCLMNSLSRNGRKPEREELAVTLVTKALIRSKYDGFEAGLKKKK